MLSLWQPWASLCVWRNPDDGKAEKQIETRGWETKYRGLLAIHATKSLVPDAKLAIETNKEIQDALARHGFMPNISGAKHLIFGAIVGVVELYAIHQSEKALPYLNTFISDEKKREKSFGNYAPNRFCWRLRNQIEFVEPIPCRGLQGLGSPPPDVAEMIFERVGKLSPSKRE